MDVVQKLAELESRIAALEIKAAVVTSALPDDAAKHFRKVDYVLDMYFGNEVIKFNEAEATAAAAASVSEAAVAAASGAGS